LLRVFGSDSDPTIERFSFCRRVKNSAAASCRIIPSRNRNSEEFKYPYTVECHLSLQVAYSGMSHHGNHHGVCKTENQEIRSTQLVVKLKVAAVKLALELIFSGLVKRTKSTSPYPDQGQFPQLEDSGPCRNAYKKSHVNQSSLLKR
jgi:hypothetical protein